jgi:hypothetical protein
MNLPDVRRKCTQRRDGIAHSVEDHVGRIKVDTYIRVRNVCERCKQCDRVFLASLKGNAHAAGCIDVSDDTQAINHGGALNV